MDLEEKYFNSFTENDFEILVRTLETQGYVIDGKEEEGLSYSSVQIEHMSQNMFNRLCTKFNISSKINIFCIGHFYPTEGAFYIVYNKEIYELEEAKKIMDIYISTL